MCLERNTDGSSFFVFKHIKERMNQMKKKKEKTLWSDVSVLIIAVLAITAFLRGTVQLVALIIAFTLWAAYAVRHHLIPFIKEVKALREVKVIQERYEKQARQQPIFFDLEPDSQMSLTLLRHVNHRISAHLQSLYPNATWDWCEKNPEKLVAKGGIGRIKIEGIPDFNYAEITLDQSAKIDCQLIKIVPLGAEQSQKKSEEKKPAPEKKPASEVNPQIWYEQKGKSVLTNLIVDLNSRGHKSLRIQEDGTIVIKQGEKEIKKKVFEFIPDKVAWPRLLKVFEGNGFGAEITKDSIRLSW